MFSLLEVSTGDRLRESLGWNFGERLLCFFMGESGVRGLFRKLLVVKFCPGTGGTGGFVWVGKVTFLGVTRENVGTAQARISRFTSRFSEVRTDFFSRPGSNFFVGDGETDVP